MKKNFINKKLYFILILLILIIVLIISCKKINILGPNNIPPPADFVVPDNTIPSHVDVRPETAPDNAVFGTYLRRFVYKGKWYILAKNMYDYDAVNKTLTKTANNIVLSMDSDNKIVVYAKNLPETGSYSYNNPQIFDHLRRANIIDDSEIWYEENTYIRNRSYRIESIRFGKKDLYSIQTKMYSNNLSYHSSDLINWTTKGSRDNFVKEFPEIIRFPTQIQGDSNFLLGFDWQRYGLYYAYDYHNFYFKGKFYILGGVWGWIGSNSIGKNDVGKYKVIDYNKDFKDLTNYQYIKTPWKGSGIEVRVYEDKIYVRYHGYYSWDYYHTENGVDIYYCQYHKDKDTIYYATENGIDWKIENSFPKSGSCFSVDNLYMNSYSDTFGPDFQSHPATPPEPNWTKVGNIYYITSKSDDPYAPYEEIREAADRGETQFTITDEHIKKAGLNSFMMSEVHPDKAKEDDWKLITPNNYTEQSFVWQGSENYLFNFNDKIVRLVDYDDLTVRKYDYNRLLNYAKYWREKGDAGGYTDGWTGVAYDKEECYFRAMYAEARAYMIKKISSFDGKYYYPDEAVTHYVVEFRY